MTGADVDLVFVGISAALFFIFVALDGVCRLSSKLMGYQMAVVTDQASRLAAARKMKRFDNAREQALAPDPAARRILDVGYTA